MMKPYLRDRQKEAKVSTVTGIVLTVTVHVLACLLCVFTGMKYIYPPPQEQTFLVDFSEDEPQPVRRQNRGRQPLPYLRWLYTAGQEKCGTCRCETSGN